MTSKPNTDDKLAVINEGIQNYSVSRMFAILGESEKARPCVGRPFLGQKRQLTCHELQQELSSLGQDLEAIQLLLVPNPFEDIHALTLFLQELRKHLRPGARLYGQLDNPHNEHRYHEAYARYGFQKKVVQPLKSGHILQYQTQLEQPSLYLSEADLTKSFEAAGFQNFQFYGPFLSEDIATKWPKGFWDLFMEEPPFFTFSASFL